MTRAKLTDEGQVPRVGRWFESCSVAGALVVAVFALLPAEPLFNVPLAVMALFGFVIFVRRPRVAISSKEARLLLALFLCIWLPMLFSLPDAVNVSESIRKTISLLPFWFAGIYLLAALGNRNKVRWMLYGLFAVATFWWLDALWQFSTGHNIVGYPYASKGHRLTGVFYPQFTIGVVLAVIAPLYFDVLRRLAARWPWVIAAVFPYAAVVVLSGSRSAWVVLLLATLGYLLFLWRLLPTRQVGRMLATLVLGAVCLGAVVSVLAPTVTDSAKLAVAKRLQNAGGVVSGDFHAIDEALSYRLSLWVTGKEMVVANWLNGIGPRGFRYAYYDYAPPDDYYRTWGYDGPPLSAHLVGLEVAVETGLIGIVGYLLFVTVLVRQVLNLAPEDFAYVCPPVLAVLVAMFPLNVHKSFYGNFSTSFLWSLILISVMVIASNARTRTTTSASL